MSFEIKVNGETVHEIDVDPRQVTGVRLYSAQGEAGVAGSPFNGVGSDWINIGVDIQQPDVLPILEDNARNTEDAPEEYLTTNENAIRAEEALNPSEEESTEESPELDVSMS